MDIYEWQVEQERETLLHLEDEQRSGTGVFEEMRKLENTAFGVSPCEDCGELPCRCEWVQRPAKMSNIAMILERHDLGTLYAQLAYVRILEEGQTEPIDASVGGDVATYLQRFHQAVLVDAPSFMEEWDRRRIQAKKESK